MYGPRRWKVCYVVSDIRCLLLLLLFCLVVVFVLFMFFYVVVVFCWGRGRCICIHTKIGVLDRLRGRFKENQQSMF